MLKKFISTALAGLALCSLLAVPALAHGHHGGHGHYRTAQPATCEPCTVEGCTEVGRHLHDGTYYCGAQPRYELCPVEGCTVVGRHLHDGTYYCGACHAEGYCDGECPLASPETPSRYCGHHGSRHCR